MADPKSLDGWPAVILDELAALRREVAELKALLAGADEPTVEPAPGVRRALVSPAEDGEVLGVWVCSDGSVFFAGPDVDLLPQGEQLADLQACVVELARRRSEDLRFAFRLTGVDGADTCELCNEPAEPGCGKNGIDHLCAECADGLP